MHPLLPFAVPVEKRRLLRAAVSAFTAFSRILPGVGLRAAHAAPGHGPATPLPRALRLGGSVHAADAASRSITGQRRASDRRALSQRSVGVSASPHTATPHSASRVETVSA